MISIVIITLNEARNLERQLPVITSISNDIVIVDAGSTDETALVCEQFGVRLIEKLWEGYGAAKNYGASAARHPWILSLDADEIPNENLVEVLRHFQPQRGATYAISLRTYLGKKWIRGCGWYPELKRRLYHRDDEAWSLEAVHEQLVSSRQTTVQSLDGFLDHFSYQSVEHLQIKSQHYAELAAQRLIEEKRSVPLLLQYFSPSFRFFKTFVLKRGFVDGKVGWIISRELSRMVRRKYELYREFRKRD